MRIDQLLGVLVSVLGLTAIACGDGGSNNIMDDTGSETGNETGNGSNSGEAGEGNGESEAGEGSGDGDGDPGDGDGDPSGDGDGDPSGDGDGDPSGDGDGDPSGDGDGEPDVCGDGIVGNSEACDDANNGDDHDACLDGCIPASCGDGLIWAGNENCDDGNADPDDGCDASCLTELYFDCVDEGPGSCNPIRILYAISDVDSPAYRAAVSMITGGPVDYFDAGVASPTLMQLQASYDCVFTHPSFRYHDSMTMGTVLRDFVDSGGSVVLGIGTDFVPPIGLDGTPIMDVDYSPITTASMYLDGHQDYSGDGVTVLHTDVGDYGIGSVDTEVMLQGAGLEDGTYGDGTISAAYRPDFKVVYLDGTGDPAFGPTGDWDLLLANACGAAYVQ